MEQDKPPGVYLDGIIKWVDIAKGLGAMALEFVTKRFINETPSEHHVAPPTAVQQDADVWASKIDVV
jgi:hypothetical protein